MTHIIKSKLLGKTLTFSRPSGSYIYCDMGEKGKEGTLGYQICKGGSYNHGSTLSYIGDDKKEFKKICHNWYYQLLRIAI